MQLRYLVLATALVGCGAGDAPKDGDGDGGGKSAREASSGSTAASDVCTVAQASQPLPGDVHESSGVAASRAHAGVFWTHNDSGEPVVTAVNAAGARAGAVRVTGARVEDWEDIAIAPCPSGGDCLYVADIGDNQAKRQSVTVWRFPEPGPTDAQTRPADALRFTYPDGPQDAEAMFVLPDGTIHIITKGETGPIAVYRARGAAAGATVALERVRALNDDETNRKARITGAAASADGEWVAVRTLRDVSFYRTAGLLGSEQAAHRMDLGPLDETQGEAVAFTGPGALLLTSEGGKKKDPATFARLTCTL
ncbi:MAG TPA: hypothetical protein VE913_08530 [Longimicrobium sp.]|nr:hypothetical protein [Longimicrobium sp.]